MNQGENLDIAQLLLAGPGAGLGQIDEYFTQRLGYTTTLIDPIQALSLQVPQEISQEKRPGLGVAIGLGLREA